MSADLRIRKLRMPGGSAVRDDPETATRKLGLVPRDGDRSLLVIRRLSVSLGDAATAREKLATLRRTAAQPVLSLDDGGVDAQVDAVVFTDEAEALLCLSVDLVRGTARDHWWWQGRIPKADATTGSTLAALWMTQPKWVPAVLSGLLVASPALAAQTIASLGDHGCRAVLAALLAEFHSVRVADEIRPPAVLTPDPATVRLHDWVGHPATAPAVGAGVRALGHRLSAPAYTLLAVATLLDRQPALGQDAGLCAWARRAITPNKCDETSPTGPRQPQSMSTVPHTRAVVPAASSHTALMTQEETPHETPDEEQPLAPVVPIRGTGAPAAPHGTRSGSGTPTNPYPPWAGSGPATGTEMATMFYAINLMRWFDLIHPTAQGVPAVRSGWAVVEALARWILRRVVPDERRDLLADPLLPLLAELDGRPPGVPTKVRLGNDVRQVRRFLDTHDVGPEVFLMPGTILVSRTHVDVVLSLSEIAMSSRKSGLDQDPGWVPELGRIVLFHFEGGA